MPTSRAAGSAGGPGNRGLDPRRLVFIDETWIKTNMAPLGAGDRRANACAASRRTALAHADLPRRVALRSPHRALRLRRTDQRPMLPRLCRAAARAGARARRHRRHGQSRSHKSAAIRQMIRAAGAQALVPAALFTRPQSDRAGLRQDQALDADRPEAHHRGDMAPRRPPRLNHPTQTNATTTSQRGTLPSKHEML